MSDGQEFYAATVDEAVDKASTALGVPRDRLDFEVQDEGSTGFLGIGARDARILVERPELKNAGRPALGEESLTPEYSEERHSEERQTPPVEEAQEVVHILEDNGSVAEEVPEDLIFAIDEFVTALVEAMGLDATVDAYDAGDMIAVDVATKETGLFIGQKGETIDAIQYLLNVAVYKNRPFVKRIIVDAEGYRQRRTEAIQGMAHRTARRALREKRSLSLPPMTAAERRVVHVFLKEHPNVTTSSEGKEEARRVIVSPIL
jgi:spoIIIJ-associated protein